MSETDKPFTVSDKRHFTPEGRPRDESEEAHAPDPPREEPHAEAGGPRAPGGPADFSQFVVGLAAQAGALLTGEGLPEGVDPRDALDGAQSIIAILEMLKGKTEGRLSEPEERVLDELLFQLRMAYVEKTRTGGA
jgi:Domain of unknown function (DUF1844)